MVSAYPARPAYPSAVIALLADLVHDTPRVVLDIGCGTGELARRLALLVDRVDAVDFSAGMLDLGRRLSGGDVPTVNWIVGTAEDVALNGPYALITAGKSLHWMDWDVVFAAVCARPHRQGRAGDRPPILGGRASRLGTSEADHRTLHASSRLPPIQPRHRVGAAWAV